MNKDVTIVIPKGRLFRYMREIFAKQDIELPSDGRKYFYKDFFEKGVNLFIAKPRAIPQLLESGMCQFGFCGKDIMEDFSSVKQEEGKITILKNTHQNEVDMVFAVNPNVDFNNLHRPIICATEFPNVAAKYLIEKKGLSTYILNTTGSTEVYVHVGADCIIDVCETGETIKANGLVVKDILFKTSTCLYGVNNIEQPAVIKQLLNN